MVDDGGAQAGAGGAVSSLLSFAVEKGASAAAQATEEADKRAWTTLPGRIEVARVLVEPGNHDLKIRLPRGGVVQIQGVKVKAGKRTFVGFKSPK